MNGTREGRLRAAICLILALATLAIFIQVRHFEFVNFDDTMYITRNAHVLRGLGWANVGWAFTTGECANWHPITWLSHMGDVTLFGQRAGGHHLTSVLFHGANAVLLFLVLRKLTRETWPSALVAALFAVHPLHVESVAWVAERKDVLSTFFAMLCLLAYQEHLRNPRRLLQWAALGAFALGLMAKPMLVSLPLLLLILDFWPLGRMDGWAGFRRLCLEKIPYAILAGASCVATLVVQAHGGAVLSMERLPLAYRAGNALLSLVRYLGMAIWPVHLAPFYPLDLNAIHLGKSLFILGGLGVVTALAIWARRSRPYLLAGWAWYLVSLLPVIGLVQVGSQALADRYTYLPMTGPFLVLAWGGRDLARFARVPRRALGAVTGMLLGALAVMSVRQTSHWRSSITLFRYTLGVTSGNLVAQVNLAEALYAHGQYGEALDAYRAAMLIRPNLRMVRFGLAQSLAALGRWNEALEAYKASLEVMPEDWVALQHISPILLDQGRLEEALPFIRRLLDLEPLRLKEDPEPRRQLEVSQGARMRLGYICRKLGRDGEAADWFAGAFRVNPRDLNAGYNLALSLDAAGRSGEAIAVLEQCVALDPARTAPRERLEILNARRRTGGGSRGLRNPSGAPSPSPSRRGSPPPGPR